MKAPTLLYRQRCRALHAGSSAPIGKTGTAIGGATVESPGLLLGEMAFEYRPRDDTDVFLLRSTISLTNRRVVGTVSLKEMLRNEGTRLLYRQRCDITQRSVFLRSAWSSDTRAASL